MHCAAARGQNLASLGAQFCGRALIQPGKRSFSFFGFGRVERIPGSTDPKKGQIKQEKPYMYCVRLSGKCRVRRSGKRREVRSGKRSVRLSGRCRVRLSGKRREGRSGKRSARLSGKFRAGPPFAPWFSLQPGGKPPGPLLSAGLAHCQRERNYVPLSPLGPAHYAFNGSPFSFLPR